jgi:ABC-type multidrug transport system ATPase subunit
VGAPPGPPGPPDAFAIALRDGHREYLLPSGRHYLVGTDPASDIRIGTGPLGAWFRFRFLAGWVLRVENETVRITLDDRPLAERQVKLAPDGVPHVLRIEGPGTPPAVLQFAVGAPLLAALSPRSLTPSPVSPSPVSPPPVSAPPAGPAARTTPPGPGGQSWPVGEEPLTIGRSGGPAAIQLDGLDVALDQASVRWTGRLLEVRSRATGARPFVNGQAMLHARIPVGGEFMIGNHNFLVRAPGVLELRRRPQAAGGAVLSVRGATLKYRSRDTPTLRDVSFDLALGQVLAVIGPSGAGKSTLCGGLTGEVEAVAGTIQLGQVDLARAAGQANHLVSFVPQQPAMYAELGVRQALLTVARLRLSQDVGEAERRHRVDTVLARLALVGEAGKRIGELSGGQLKRVSVAMELLSDPLLLVLDEPTSGLDEGLDKDLMNQLRDLAAQGVAVVVVTHSMVNIDRADLVLALTSTGRPGYLGPPGEVQRRLGGTWAEVMDRLRADHATPPPLLPPVPAMPAATALKPTNRRATGLQLRPMVTREFQRQFAGWRKLLLTLLAFPVITALLSAEGAAKGLGDSALKQRTVLLILVVCLTFFAMAQSFSSIVDDRIVIQRESRWGISAASIVLARMIAFALPALWIGFASIFLYLQLRPGPREEPLLPGPSGIVLFALLTAIAAMALGLLVSALAPTLRQVVSVLMAVLAVQVVFTGIALPLAGTKVLNPLSYLSPTRWSVAGLGADIGIDAPGCTGARCPPNVRSDRLWQHDASHMWAAATMLIVLAVVVVAATTWVLDRQLRRRR